MKTPRTHQEQAIALGRDHNPLLFYETGLGKTLIGAAIAREFRDRSVSRANLVVASPAGSLGQWVREIRDQDPYTPVEVWDSNNWRPLKRGEAVWIVTHYDAVPRLLPVLSEVLWATIVADECHKIKNPQAKRTKAFKKLQAQRRVAMTGSPKDKYITELWSVLNWLYPPLFKSRWKFDQEYVTYERNYLGYHVPVGYKNLDQLTALMRPFTRVETKESAAPYLPPLIHTLIPIRLGPQQRRAYDKIRKADDIELDLSDLGRADPMLIKHAMDRIIKEQRAASYPASLGLDMPSAKFEWLREWLEANPEQQVIVFTRFQHTAKVLAEMLKCAFVIGGQISGLDDFQERRQRIVVGTIGALGTAYDLPMADTSIFMELERPHLLNHQARGRHHREGITTPKQCIYLVAEDTIDEVIYQADQEKWDDNKFIYEALRRGL
jgi:SNF2 family DNA or RNA helicase